MSTNYEKLVAVYAGPANDLEKALQDCLTLRDIFNATGIWLDRIGKIVGRDRNGLLDDTYRRYLFAQIAVNRSTGRREELINIARLVLNTPIGSGSIRIRTESNASFILEVQDIAVNDTVAGVLHDMLSQAVAAGVRIVFVWSAVPLAQTFRLDAGPGLDQGHLARGIDNEGAV